MDRSRRGYYTYFLRALENLLREKSIVDAWRWRRRWTPSPPPATKTTTTSDRRKLFHCRRPWHVEIRPLQIVIFSSDARVDRDRCACGRRYDAARSAARFQLHLPFGYRARSDREACRGMDSAAARRSVPARQRRSRSTRRFITRSSIRITMAIASCISNASAPLPASIPVTIHFRREAHRGDAEPRARAAQHSRSRPAASSPSSSAPTSWCRSTAASRRSATSLGDETASPWQQAQIIYEYVVSRDVVRQDRQRMGPRRRAFTHATCGAATAPISTRCLSRWRARAAIPARFTIGFPIGKAKSGEVPGYHCWAEFYAGGEWVPVDASEAWKNPGAPRLLLRPSRCGAGRVHDGPRPRS